MKRRVKIGDVEVSVGKNPDQTQSYYVVTRYRPRKREYLSTQHAFSVEEAEYLFQLVIDQEEARQKQAAQNAQGAETKGLPAPHYENNQLYARF